MYKIEPKLQKNIKALLLKSQKEQTLHYDTYSREGTEFDLGIIIKKRYKNKYGKEISISVDFIKQMPDRDDPARVIRYFKEYQVQYLDGIKFFNDYLIIFGPKIIDKNLMKAIKNQLPEENEAISDPFILMAVDFGAMGSLLKQFPNLKHFCIRDIPDEKTKGVIVRGHRLEETDLFNRFVVDEDTKGPINFIGITTDMGKIVYLGKDGSIYSRMNFEKEDIVKVVYNLYLKLQKIKALKKMLDEF